MPKSVARLGLFYFPKLIFAFRLSKFFNKKRKNSVPYFSGRARDI